MRVFFTEHAKRDLRSQRVPLEAALATLLQPDETMVRAGRVHATRKLSIGGTAFVVRSTYQQYAETQSVLCICKRPAGDRQ